MLKDLNSILGYIDRLNELDTSNVEPMAQVASRYGQRKGQADGFVYAMREDVPRPCLPHEEALKNAPQTDGTFFKVPKVIGLASTARLAPCRASSSARSADSAGMVSSTRSCR